MRWRIQKILLLPLFVVPATWTATSAAPNPPRSKDTPDFISERQRLPKRELDKKTEGWYPFVFPILSRHETLGSIYGIGGGVIDHGKRSDPLFKYTSFRKGFGFGSAVSTRGWQRHTLLYGSLYEGDTPWSYLVVGGFVRDINALYMGSDERTMKRLTYFPRNDRDELPIANGSFDEHQQSLKYRRVSDTGRPFTTHLTDQKYNRHHREYPYAGGLVGRTFWREFYMVGGIKSARYVIKTYDDKIFRAPDPVLGETDLSAINVVVPTVQAKTRLTEDHEAGDILGFGGGWVTLVRFGVAYDTRDMAQDPSRGVYFEVTHERSDRAWGSGYQFTKTLVQGKVFYSPFPRLFEKLVLAGRAGFMRTSGDPPFFKLPDFFSAEKANPEFSGLGGPATLHGYQTPRFVGPAMAFANVEIRWKVGSDEAFGWLADFVLAPFYGVGRVWDDPLKAGLKGYAHDLGLSARIVINKSLVLSLSVARSDEDRTFNISVNHPF